MTNLTKKGTEFKEQGLGVRVRLRRRFRLKHPSLRSFRLQVNILNGMLVHIHRGNMMQGLRRNNPLPLKLSHPYEIFPIYTTILQ